MMAKSAATPRVVGSLQEVRDPADRVLGRDNLEVWEALERAFVDQAGDRVRNLNETGALPDKRIALIGHRETPALLPLTGQDMEVDRHIHLLGGRPEWIVEGALER